MSAYKSDFLNTLDERGFIHQLSDAEGLDNLLMKEIVSAYIGFDCTAASLHAGSLVQIMLLYWLQQTGHRPVALMGGGTSMIGNADTAEGGSVDAAHAEGTLLGKRYVDESGDLELLCVKPGDGSLALGGAALVLKEAKALPSSD